jgi:hypothetical protein
MLPGVVRDVMGMAPPSAAGHCQQALYHELLHGPGIIGGRRSGSSLGARAGQANAVPDLCCARLALCAYTWDLTTPASS